MHHRHRHRRRKLTTSIVQKNKLHQKMIKNLYRARSRACGRGHEQDFFYVTGKPEQNSGCLLEKMEIIRKE